MSLRRALAALLIGSIAAPVIAAPAPASVPPIAFTERTLGNGLRVYAIRDTTTPNVAIQMWYDVGSKDDPKGRSGFAHMFEHLMFKATRNLVSEQFDRLTEDVGGNNNASTNDDYTEYHETVPANHLQRLLFAEADRMASLVVEPRSFGSERAVVEEELRQSTLARPYGKLFSVDLSAASYTRHPYARSTIGSIPNLESASIDDVRAFHATYYRPDNAILVVSGNFDPAQLNAWVDRYFAGIARPSTPIPRVTVVEPPRTHAVSYTVYEANTPLPAVLLSYHVPPDRAPDVPALTVLQTILATGESSRLYQSLVYRDQLAQDAAASLDTKQGTGNLAVYAIMAGGKDVALGEAALKREIAALRDTPVSAADLAQAKNQIVTATLRSRETAEGKARTIASSAIIDGDPHDADRQLAAIATVSAADVQRVARAYLADDQAVTIRYLPIESKPASAVADTIAVSPSVVVADLAPPRDVAIVTPASAAERASLPPVAAAVKPNVPQPVETVLANGIRLVTLERHGLPLVTATLVARGGAADTRAPAGAASLSATLLTKGTATRSATQIARAIESLGGSIGSDADRDGATIDVTVKSDQLAPAMDILADVARNPAFAAPEIERARAQAVDAAGVALKNPAQVAALAASRAVFGAHPYGAPLEGTPASLAAITRGDLTASYRRSWVPARTTLILVGDITPAKAIALANARFADWHVADAAAAPMAPPLAAPAPRVIVVDMPDAGQAGVVVARTGIARADPRYYPLALANTILGGGFSSRLNQEIRIKRGLAYGAGSSMQARREPGLIAARTQTKNPSAAEVVELIVAQMRAMGAAPASPGEIETRKAVLVGNFGATIETTGGAAGLLANYVEEDVPLAELQRFTDRVQAVDADAEQKVSVALLDPAPASIVVAGDARQFLPALRKVYPQLEVIPSAALKLDVPALR
ncbi:pitrilysin family protein [Sphingomonas sp. CROZ-RG-20F-R02-07]|uniref:M16 family metallopeptidase n=1 Tax=Sphingomonas sp. CROZ-RG-20F-R02-07 TaxID=2914832 RepID=UPI001F56A02D